MRCDNINVTYKMQIPIDKPDGNGNIYTKESAIKAFSNLKNKPISQYDDKGRSFVIGVVEDSKVEFDEQENEQANVWIDGIIFHDGTNESVEIEDGKIVSFDIKNVENV